LAVPSARAYELQSSGIWESSMAEHAFASGLEMFYAGPQWFLNALPGSGSARVRAAQMSVEISGDGEMTHAEYVGTQSRGFELSLFDNVQPFAHSTQAFAITGPLAPLADAATTLWSSAGGSAWLTGTNWTGGAVPTGAQTAELGANPTAATGVGINFANATNAGTQTNGNRIEEVGAVYVDSNRAAAMIIGNSSATAGATGKFRLNGVTVNGVDNVIIRNNSSQLLTIQNTQAGGTQTMSVLLGNATDNIINIDGIGGVTISSIIVNDAGNHITLGGAGSGVLTLSGANTFTGGVTINSGTLRAGSTTALGPAANATLTFGAGSTGKFQLNGFDTTIIDLTTNATVGTPIIESGSGTGGTDTLTVNTANTDTYAGVLQNGSTRLLALTKSGAGTLILSGNNTYTGGTTINAGILRAGTTTAIGQAASATLTFGSGSTGTFQLFGFDTTVVGLNSNTLTVGTPVIENGTAGTATLTDNTGSTDAFAGVLQNGSAGTSALTKTGNGTLILKGTNTYSGDTQILAGDLRFDAGGTSNNSTIRLGDTAANSTFALLTLGVGNGNNVGSVLEVRPSSSGSQGLRVLRSLATTGTNTYSGTITMNAALTLQSATAGNLLLEGGSVDVKGNVLTVDSQVINLGVGPNGADSVSNQGTVTINEVLGSSLATGGSIVKDGSGTLILQGTSNTYTGTVNTILNANGTRIAGGTLGIYGDGGLGLAPATATNNVFFTSSSLTSPPSTRTLQDTSGDVTLGATRNVNIASSVTGTFDSNGNTFTIAGVINGNGAIATTTGTNAGGTVIFTNGNTYSGGTTVQSGTLLVNNPAATSGTGGGAVVVNNGGTLGGNGFINTGANTVTINGKVDPGAAANTTGALTLTTASTIFGSTGVFHVDIGGSAVDHLLTSGTFDLTAIGDTISFNLIAPLTQSSYTLATYSGVALGVFDNFNTPSGYVLVYNLGELDLVATAVPESSTWIGAALALVAIGWTQRKGFGKKAEPLKS